MIVLACVCLPVVSFLPVDDRVTEEERAEEPEDPCHEQEAAATDAYISEGKFHRPLREWLHPCEDV